MTALLVTADTNIIASGLLQLQAHPDAAPARFVQAWRASQFRVVHSEALRAEVFRTLARPYFANRLTPEDHHELERLFDRYSQHTNLTVRVEGVATHREDDMVLATALSGNGHFLVTGDHKLAGLKQYQGVILVTVHEFLAMLPGLLGTA